MLLLAGQWQEDGNKQLHGLAVHGELHTTPLKCTLYRSLSFPTDSQIPAQHTNQESAVCQLYTHISCVFLQVPLVVWMLAVIIFSAVSLQELSGLQGPLASLNVAAHTLYRTGRVRSLLSLFAFEEDRAKVEEYRHSLQAEVDLLRKEYSILLYGGKVDRVVSHLVCKSGYVAEICSYKSVTWWG